MTKTKALSDLTWPVHYAVRNEVTVPEIGMAATYSINGDSYGCTIIHITPSSIDVGRSGVPDERFTRRKDGSFCAVGTDYVFLTIGVAQDVRDLSF